MALSGWRSAAFRSHLIVFAAFTAFFGWLFARFYLYHLFLSDSDLYEYFLPLFLSPIRVWSSYEFGGLPAFADPGNFTFYPPNMLFGALLHSWTTLAASAYVLAAWFTYAYVYSLTRSIPAAIVSALAYSSSEAMLERLAHLGSVHAIAWLPLAALAIDRMRQQPAGPRLSRASRVWLAVGACAIASCVLSGHPQPAIYIIYVLGLYALAGLVVERASVKMYTATASVFVIGGLLSAVKVLPLVEASRFMARQEINFDRFVGRSLSATQAWSFLFPTVLHGETRELPTYVGVATLMLAAIALTRPRANWRIPFWTVIGLLAIASGLGTATPLVDFAYQIPLYNKFRNISRHLFLFAFGAAVLAGFGVAALERRQITRRAFWRAVSIPSGLMAIGAVLMAVASAAFEFEVPLGEPGPGPLAVLSIGVWVQCALATAAVATAYWMWRSGASKASVAMLIVLLGADLLNALPYNVRADGLDLTAISAVNTTPSVHAIAIGRQLEPESSRALAIGGTGSDEVIPAAFARVWRIPIAGGYGPMLLDRYSQFAMMGTNGEVRPAALGTDDVSLDLLAVREIIVNKERLEQPAVQQWLQPGDRWRASAHFRTSRTTDRGADVDTDDEEDVTVFENARALPRAWFASELIAADDAGALIAVHESKLPDGRRFEPRSMALVAPAQEPTSRSFGPGASMTRIVRVGDGDISLTASSEGGGFLVLSENFYPGWRARVDGVSVPIYRTDVTLQGIVVPSGRHRIDFTLESGTLHAGYAMSAAALVVCAWLVLSGRAQQAKAG